VGPTHLIRTERGRSVLRNFGPPSEDLQQSNSAW